MVQGEPESPIGSTFVSESPRGPAFAKASAGAAGGLWGGRSKNKISKNSFDQEIASLKSKIQELVTSVKESAQKAITSEHSVKEIALKAIESTGKIQIAEKERSSREESK